MASAAHLGSSLTAQGIAISLWAIAHFRYRPGAQWLSGYLENTRGLLRGLTAQGAALTLWALSKMRHVPDATWLQCYFETTLDVLPSANSQNLANLAQALRKLGIKPTEAWSEVYTARVRSLLTRSFTDSRDVRPAQQAASIVLGLDQLKAELSSVTRRS